MTRENKLALVIGFGLILIVGILVSDHFSAARRQAPPSLVPAVDPLAGDAWNDPDLIAVHTREETDATGTVIVDPAMLPESEPAPERPERTLPPGDARTLSYVHHEVARGESLTTICRAYYGDASLVRELARYNDLADADAIRVGQRLLIPKAADLVRGGEPPASAQPAPVAAPSAPKTYTVRKNDSLSEIAQRLLGSGRKYLVLYEANRDVLSSPDALRPGMVLRIPGAER